MYVLFPFEKPFIRDIFCPDKTILKAKIATKQQQQAQFVLDLDLFLGLFSVRMPPHFISSHSIEIQPRILSYTK